NFSLMRDGEEELEGLCEIKKCEVQVNELFAAADDDDEPVDDDDEPVTESKTKKAHQVGEFVPDHGYKLPGPQRLRRLLAVKPETGRLVFQYYFEKFGEVIIPS